MMRKFGAMPSALGALFSLLVAALPASADPILSVSPTSIALSPSTTLITFEIIPSGSDVAVVVLNLSAVDTGLTILSITPGPDFSAMGPSQVGGFWLADFVDNFSADQSGTFTVGTVLVRGLAENTQLLVNGSITDSAFNEFFYVDYPAATVVPEPTTALLLSLGLLFVARLGRRHT